jgi:hypothetical protein
MSNLIRYHHADTAAPWTEDDLQMAIVQALRRLGVTFATDPNPGRQSKRAGGKRKALGLVAGEPDIRLYLPGGRTVFIELKKWTGAVSKEQKARHAELRALGFDVHIVKAKTPADAVYGVMEAIEIAKDDMRTDIDIIATIRHIGGLPATV